MTQHALGASPAFANALTPCPRRLLERAREEWFPPYRQATREVAFWQRDVALHRQIRHETHSPLTWFNALVDEGISRVELHLARRYQKKLVPFLPDAQIRRRLGWPEGYEPDCANPPPMADPLPPVVVAAMTEAPVCCCTKGKSRTPQAG